MIFEVQTKARIEVPEGSTVEEVVGGQGAIILPDGTRLKAFVAVEMDEMEDLTTTQLEELDCHLEHLERTVCEAE